MRTTRPPMQAAVSNRLCAAAANGCGVSPAVFRSTNHSTNRSTTITTTSTRTG